MACIRTGFSISTAIGGTLILMSIFQMVMSLFGYTYEMLADLGDPTQAGIILLVIGLVFLGIGKGGGWLLEKIAAGNPD